MSGCSPARLRYSLRLRPLAQTRAGRGEQPRLHQRHAADGTHDAAFNSVGASTLVAFVSSHPPWNGLPVSIGGLSDNVGNTWSVT